MFFRTILVLGIFLACFFYFYILTLHSKFTTKFCTKYWIKQAKFVPSKRTSLHAAQQTSAAKLSEAVVQRCYVEKVLLDILSNSQESTCARASFLIKFTLAQVFSCQFCEISKISYLQNTCGGCFRITFIFAKTLKHSARSKG